MMLNVKKTKIMIFNFTENHQFTTRLELENQNVEVIENAKLLGTILSKDLKWNSNTSNLIKRANARMILLQKLVSFRASIEDLKTIYILFIRSILEQSATVWHSSISSENSNDIERVQKSAIKMILQKQYKGYKKGLQTLGLDSLETRRSHLCLQFAKKCTQNKKLAHMFPENTKNHTMNTRNAEKYKVQHANTLRLQNSPIIYMQKLLNKDESMINKG